MSIDFMNLDVGNEREITILDRIERNIHDKKLNLLTLQNVSKALKRQLEINHPNFNITDGPLSVMTTYPILDEHVSKYHYSFCSVQTCFEKMTNREMHSVTIGLKKELLQIWNVKFHSQKRIQRQQILELIRDIIIYQSTNPILISGKFQLDNISWFQNYLKLFSLHSTSLNEIKDPIFLIDNGDHEIEFKPYVYKKE